MPGNHTLYEYFWDMDKRSWIAWAQIVPKYIHDPERKYNEILVPTVDTVRTTWLLKLQTGIKKPVVLVGETGTSKSATTHNFLRNTDTESHVSVGCLLLIFMNLELMVLRNFDSMDDHVLMKLKWFGNRVSVSGVPKIPEKENNSCRCGARAGLEKVE